MVTLTFYATNLACQYAKNHNLYILQFLLFYNPLPGTFESCDRSIPRGYK